MNEQNSSGSDVGLSAGLGVPTGWAWARHDDAEDWCGGFVTRDEAVADLLATYPGGGWVCQTRDLTEDDYSPAGEDWEFLFLVDTAELVSPNIASHR